MRTEDLVNSREYRQNMRAHHERAKRTGRPIFVTNRGVPEAVVLAPEVYDELADRAEISAISAMIERSDADLAAGRGADARTVLRALASKYGLTDDP